MPSRRLLMTRQILQDLDLAFAQFANRGDVLQINTAVQELHGVLHRDLVVVGTAQFVELGLQAALQTFACAEPFGYASRTGQDRLQIAFEAQRSLSLGLDRAAQRSRRASLAPCAEQSRRRRRDGECSQRRVVNKGAEFDHM